MKYKIAFMIPRNSMPRAFSQLHTFYKRKSKKTVEIVDFFLYLCYYKLMYISYVEFEEGENTMTFSDNLTCVIVDEIATLSESGKWKKQLNIVQWGDNIAKYDIRSWNEDKTKSGKGITLSIEEVRALRNALNTLDI